MEKIHYGQQGSVTLAVVFGMFFLSSIWGGIYAIHRYYVYKNKNEISRFTQKWERLEKKYKTNKRYRR